jgi:hypothetical protein
MYRPSRGNLVKDKVPSLVEVIKGIFKAKKSLFKVIKRLKR